MRVDHRGPHILVPKELLNRSDIIATFEQMCCKRVSKAMASCPLYHTCITHRRGHGFLDERLVHVMAAPCQVSRAAIAACIQEGLFRLRHPHKQFARKAGNLLLNMQLRAIQTVIRNAIWFPDKAPALRLKPAC